MWGSIAAKSGPTKRVPRPKLFLMYGSLRGRAECEQFSQIPQNPVRPSARWLPEPVLFLADTGGDAKTDGAAASRHDHFDERIIAHDANPAHGNTEFPCDEPQRIQGGLAGKHHGCPRHLAHCRRNRVRISHHSSACSGEKRHIGGNVERGSVPNCPDRGFDILHPALWIDRKSTRLNSSHTVISYAVF